MVAAITASEGRLLVCETIGAIMPMLGDVTNAEFVAAMGADIIELVRIFEKTNPELPMRVDHGMTMLGDETRGYNAGYAFLGRMFAMGQVQGIMATVDRELGLKYKITGFYE